MIHTPLFDMNRLREFQSWCFVWFACICYCSKAEREWLNVWPHSWCQWCVLRMFQTLFQLPSPQPVQGPHLNLCLPSWVSFVRVFFNCFQLCLPVFGSVEFMDLVAHMFFCHTWDIAFRPGILLKQLLTLLSQRFNLLPNKTKSIL